MRDDSEVIELSRYISKKSARRSDLLDGFVRVRPVIKDVKMPDGKIVTVSQMREAAKDMIARSEDEPLFSVQR